MPTTTMSVLLAGCSESNITFTFAEEIDEIIIENLSRYTIDRLNIVDKAIIRNAVYEMVYTDLPSNIAINEAINLTKKFSNLEDDQAKKFNNKLLDNIRKTLE